jgi:glucose-1-phosphate adenylyltransferase
MNDVLTIILGGGRGTRLFPLTHLRSKPAVPIGGKWRLIDIPISNCLHAGLERIYVLTQFNSASLNRHIARTYRMDVFSGGFVEVLAAEQTPEGEQWFQGTADAVRQAARHFRDVDAEYYLILAGDHIYRMDFAELIESHIERDADITIAAQPSPPRGDDMGIFRFDRAAARSWLSSGRPPPPCGRARRPPGAATAGKPFLASMGITSSRARCSATCSNARRRLRTRIIPNAREHRVHAYLYRGYWADVGTVASFYDVNLMLTRRGSPFNFFHPRRPIYTRPRFLPAARMHDCHVDEVLVAEGAYLDSCEVRSSVVGVRSSIHAGAKVTRSVLLGADYYDEQVGLLPPVGIGPNAVLDRVIVDKNARIGEGARLVNEAGVQDLDGDGYYIRSGIIVVRRHREVGHGGVGERRALRAEHRVP